MDAPNSFTYLTQTSIFNGVWLHVHPRQNTKKTSGPKRLDYVQNMLTILISTVNIIWALGGGGVGIHPLNMHKNLHFDNEL